MNEAARILEAIREVISVRETKVKLGGYGDLWVMEEMDHGAGVVKLWLRGWASESAGLIIFWIAISIGAPVFEELGETSWTTTSRSTSGATILIGLKNHTWVVAATSSPQHNRALTVDIDGTLDSSTGIGGWTKVQWDVEPINKRDIEIV
ncbi:unnamed protein product [Dovyalis caffra]|uniref:Uncharacterized protein n=1 Tax=Dovyalis caffra TaxID=77055 RepID=A0AAV1RV06_9ROSI|nr:unnamed protein product [Dovyalis caffra]